MHKVLARRIMAWVLSVCIIAGMVDLSGFTVQAADIVLRGGSITILDNNIVYDGTVKEPAIEVKDINQNVVDVSDSNKFRITYEDNVNAGRGLVKVENLENTADFIDRRFDIKPKDISNCTVEEIEEQVLVAGIACTPTPTVKDGEKTLQGIPQGVESETSDYIYGFENNDTAGTGKVIITGTGNYTGTAEKTFTIIQLSLNNLTVTYTGLRFVYQVSTPIQPQVKSATYQNGSQTETLEKDKDYRLEYENNYFATEEAIVRFVGMGRYAGLTKEDTFLIKKDLSATYGEKSIKADTILDQPYAGSAGAKIKNEDVVLRDPDYPGEVLKPGIDYEVDQDSYQNNTVESTADRVASVDINGLGRYGDRMTVTFKVVAAQLSDNMVTFDDSACKYDGTDQFQNVKVTVNGPDGVSYVENQDYTVEAVDEGINAGDHQFTVKVKPGGKLKGGPVTKTYNVAQREITDSEVRIQYAGEAEYIYDGNPKTPGLQITYKGNALQAGQDYDLRYDNNINATMEGEKAKVYAVGKGNFKGETTRIEFQIKPIELTEDNTTIEGIRDEYTFTGREITCSLNVRVQGRGVLTSGTEYTVSYANNINKGTATVTISGKGNYHGVFNESFEIIPRDLSDGVAITLPPSAEYTGKPIQQEVSLSYNGVSLIQSPASEPGGDYSVEYENNEEVGEATVTITGKGNYTGTAVRTFRITGRNINTGELVVMDNDKNYNYTDPSVTADQRFYRYIKDGEKGAEIKPKLTVTYANSSISMGIRGLTEGTDYDIEFNNNDKIGTAQAVITGKGNYAGSKTLTFTIKGDFSDYNDPNGLTKVTIPEQIYTSKDIVPTNAEVIFDGVKLTSNDYDIACVNNKNVGTASANITGKGNYYGVASNVEFDIRPMNLETDDLAENQYVIGNVQESYVYWGEEIHPEPEITHHETPLVPGTDYRLDYKAPGVDNVNAGTGKIVVHGLDPNYKESHEIEFTIEKYDIGADYAKIEIEGMLDDVMLDDVKASNAPGFTMDPDDPDKVIQTGLKVKYTPVNPVTKEVGDERYLDASEYSVTYENNDTIGKAAIIFTGIGKNFTGEVRKEFRIMGKLSADSTSLQIADCVYSPAAADGSSTNTPEPVVKYTITTSKGEKKVIDLVKGVDYVVSYEHNNNATILEGQEAIVTISPVMDAEGNITGCYKEQKSTTFTIEQRDLSKAIASGSIEKDPDLEVTGVAEEGYEYTGQPIIPELQVTCKGTQLSKVIADTEETEAYDYQMSVENNVNVYTFVKGPTGSKQRVYPTVKVKARSDEEGNYIGNYKGEFQMRFQLNPREISADTTSIPSESLPEEVDYTGRPITFPSEDSENPGNRFVVTWRKNTGAGTAETVLVENQDYRVIYRDNTKIGEATIEFKAVDESNYTGSYEEHFKIMASLEVLDNIDPTVRPYMTLQYNHNVPFGDANVYPKLVIEDYSGVLCGESTAPKLLEEGEDYELVLTECKNNQNVGREDAENIEERPTVTIRGINYYRGKITRYYNITPMDLSKDEEFITVEFVGSLNTEEYQNAYIYSGEPLEPQIRVYNREKTMIPNIDYTIKGYVNNNEISTEEKKAGVTIQAVEGSNYLNEKTFDFNIIRRPIEGMRVTITDGPQVYSRTPKEPAVEVSYQEGTQTITLTPDDYDVTYENNIEVAAKTDENPPTIIITGKGAYGGTIRETFAIAPESLAEPEKGQEDDFVIKAANAIYTGEAVTTTIEVKAKDGTLLVEDQDYTIGDYHNNIAAGMAAVDIHGMGSYTGTRQIPFYITPADAEIRISEIPEQEYTSKELKPEIEVTLGDTGIVLTEGPDYEVAYSNNINAGTAKVKVQGTGNFSGEAEAEFVINPKSIGTEEDGIAQDMILGELEDQEYTGRGVTPDVSLTFQRGMTALFADGEITETEAINETLVLNRDYTLSYTGNVSVGTASVTISGIGNYAGTLHSEFRILGPMNLAEVPPIPAQEYTGEAVTPEIEVSFAGVKLVEDTDYTLEYKDNVNRGTATVIITGLGWYTGTKEVTFDIARQFSEETLILGVASAYTYTGSAITPAIQVEDKGNLLKKDVDYSVAYFDNVNAGTATITITGMGKYDGSHSTTFKIMPMNLGRADVSRVADQIYDKKDKKPQPTVSIDGVSLREGADYTIVHVNNRNPGMASVVVKGTGNYTGSQTVNYMIVIPKVTGVKAAKSASTSITFTWNRNSVVTGYEIYDSSNKRVAFIRKNSTTKATVNKLKPNTSANFRVRAYVNRSGKYYYGDFVKIKAATAPKAAKISSLASTKPKQVVIKWKKVKGATGYEVYRSTSKKGKYKKLKTTKKNSYTDKKAKGGKKNYYKIRAYKKTKTGTRRGDYSPVKSITVRK